MAHVLRNLALRDLPRLNSLISSSVASMPNFSSGRNLKRPSEPERTIPDFGIIDSMSVQTVERLWPVRPAPPSRAFQTYDPRLEPIAAKVMAQQRLRAV